MPTVSNKAFCKRQGGWWAHTIAHTVQPHSCSCLLDSRMLWGLNKLRSGAGGTRLICNRIKDYKYN